MNEMEKQFQRIVNGLAKKDRPDDEYVRRLREQTLAACRPSSSGDTSGKIRPVWRKIMIRTAVAAMILAGAFLTITSIDQSSPDNAEKAQPVRPDTGNDISPTSLKQTRELKIAAELYAAKNIPALAALLKVGSPETKLAVINYLKNIGTDEALKVLKDYESQSTEPNIISAIQKAIEAVKPTEIPAGDSITSGKIKDL